MAGCQTAWCQLLIDSILYILFLVCFLTLSSKPHPQNMASSSLTQACLIFSSLAKCIWLTNNCPIVSDLFSPAFTTTFPTCSTTLLVRLNFSVRSLAKLKNVAYALYSIETQLAVVNLVLFSIVAFSLHSYTAITRNGRVFS